MKEKRISYEGFKIKCDKCPGTLLPMISTTKMVTIGGKPVVNITDKTIGANIPMFPSCTATPTKICNPKFTKWIDTAEPTVNIEKAIPLVEHSELICTAGGGFVGFEPPVAKSEIMGPKKPNMVDRAKGKINGVANKAKSVATNATNKINSQISGVLDGAKPIGKIFDNKALKSTINGASAALNQANLSKKQIDVQLESLENQIPQLKNKISSTINDIEVPQINDLGIEKNDAITDKEEQFFQNEIQNSINELENYYNQEINTSSLVNLDGTPSNGIPTFDDRTPLERWSDNKKEHEKLLDQLAEHEYNRMTEEVTAYNKDAIFEEDESSKKAIASLYGLYVSSGQSSIPPNPQKGEITKILKEKAQKKAQKKLDKKTARSKNKLNKKIQDELDEELEKLGYNKAQKKINAAQAKSAEVQKDMDKASKWLGRMDNFDGFIDNLKEKYTGKVSAKLNKSITSINQNMALANTSMDGMSFAVDGFPKGDVVTNVKAKQEKKKEEEEEKTTPPPVVTPPEETKPPEETEETEEECNLTEITIIKNKTYEYTLLKNNYAGETKFSGSLPMPIIFIAGTTKNRKKLAIKFEGLDCSNCKHGHEKPKEYYRDGETSSLSLTNNTADISIFHDPNSVEGLFGDFVDLMFLGYRAMNPVEYSIPVELCGFSKTIQAKAYIDAEWHLLISLASKDPLTLEHRGYEESVFNKYSDIAARLDRRNAALKPDQKELKYENKGADLVIGVGAFYDNKAQSHNLSKKFNFKKIQDSSQKLFSTLDILTKFTQKAAKIGDGGKGKKEKPLKKYLGVSAKFDPPTLDVKASGNLEEKTDDPFFGIGYSGEIEIQSKLLSFELEIDLIRAAKKHPLLLFIDGLITSAEEAYKKALYYLNSQDKFRPLPRVEDFVKAKIVAKAHFFINGSKKIIGENQNTVIEGGGAGSVKILLEADLNTTSMGFQYRFNSTNELTTGISASSGLHFEDSIYLSFNSKFDGVKLTGSITYQIQGWKLTGVVAETVDKIKGFFGFGNSDEEDENLIDGDKDTKGDYLIDVDLSTKYADIQIFEEVSNSTKIYLTDKKSSGYVTGGGS
ncbi:PAAR-like protein [Aquimarina sp. 433]